MNILLNKEKKVLLSIYLKKTTTKNHENKPFFYIYLTTCKNKLNVWVFFA